MTKKWEKLKTDTVYTNPYFAVTENSVVRSNGTTGTYYVVDRYGPFSIIIPIFPDNTTILVGQYRFASEYYSWELPMGSVRGKQPQDIAIQELSEETGYTAGKWQKVGSFFVGHGHTNQKGYIFVAQDLQEGVATPEPTEDLQVKHVAVERVSTMISDGEIKDGPTIAAWYLFTTSKYYPAISNQLSVNGSTVVASRAQGT